MNIPIMIKGSICSRFYERQRLFIFDQDAYYASQNSGSSGRDGDSTTTPQRNT